MQKMNPRKPVLLCEYQFPFLATSTEVIILASDEYFGVLVGVDALGEPTSPMNPKRLRARLVRTIMMNFADFASTYIEMNDASAHPMSIPDVDDIGKHLGLLTLEMKGQVYPNEENPELTEPLRFDGEYIFITEVGIHYTEFMGNIDGGDPPHVLH